MKHCHKKDRVVGVRLFSDLKQLPPHWDEFVPAGHFLQTGNLAVTASSSLPDMSFLYALVSVNDSPVLAAGFQVLTLQSKHVNKEMTPAWKFAAWQIFTGAVRPKLLVGGHLFRHDVQSVYYADGVTDYEAYSHYKLAIDKALEHSCAMAVLIKDMPEQLGNYFRNYAREYIMLRNDISMELDVDPAWQNMDDYVNTLKHKYAQRHRKIRERWNVLDIRQLDMVQVANLKHELFDLYRQVSDHQPVRIGLLSADFLPLLMQADERLKLWGIYKGNELIGFFSAWAYEDAFDMFYIGFDYERNKEYNLYFNILFFAIEKAIAYRKPKLILGRTALDAKARLGCRPRYLSTFIYVKNSLVRNRIMQMQKASSANEGSWEDKHPFKAAL